MPRGCRRGSPSGCAIGGTVQQSQGLLDHPAVGAQPGAVFGAAPGDDRRDALLADLGAVFVVVIAAVG
jgi:hypothetical protein